MKVRISRFSIRRYFLYEIYISLDLCRSQSVDNRPPCISAYSRFSLFLFVLLSFVFGCVVPSQTRCTLTNTHADSIDTYTPVYRVKIPMIITFTYSLQRSLTSLLLHCRKRSYVGKLNNNLITLKSSLLVM